MPRKQRVMGCNLTQVSSFVFVILGVVNCLPLPCVLPHRCTRTARISVVGFVVLSVI